MSDLRSLRIKELDGVRGIAILMVIIIHYINQGLPSSNSSLLVSVTKNVTNQFWSGVDLFFVLSGFLISSILFSAKGSKNYFPVFYMRRVLRIFPLYYGVLLIFCLFMLTGAINHFPWFVKDNQIPLYSYFIYFQNYYMGSYDTFGSMFYGVTWSLCIEEQFYLVIPLVIYFLRNAYIPLVIVLLLIFSVICRAYFTHMHPLVSLPARMPGLLVGVLIGYYYTTTTLLTSTFKSFRFELVLIPFMAIFWGLKMMRVDFGNFDFLFIAVMYGLLVLIAISERETIIKKLLRNPQLVFFGTLAYGIYMYHQIVSGIMHQLILHQQPSFNSPGSMLVTLLSFVVTVLIAKWSFTYFESFFLGLNKKYKYK